MIKKNWLNDSYCKKIYIDILEYVNSRQKLKIEGGSLNIPTKLTLRDDLGRKFKYSELAINDASKNLISSGLLHNYENSSNISITEKGKLFLEDYYQFNMKGWWDKFTTIANKNVAILSLIISFISIGFSTYNVFHEPKSNQVNMLIP